MSLQAPVRTLLALTLVCSGCQVVENLALDLFKHPSKTGLKRNGLQEGKWTYYYVPSGEKKAEGHYEADKQVGPWTYWYENGNVEWEGEFDAQRFDGPSYFGHENGNRHAVGMFDGGLEEDLWTFWSSVGTVDQEGDFSQGEPVLRWRYFHPDGAPMAEGYRWQGERVGPWQFYTPTGELSERRFPLPDGVEIAFETWDGSIPRREGFVVDGLAEGRWVTNHPNGRRRLTVDFSGGVLQGRLTAWAANGALLARGLMQGDHPVGEWHVWRDGVREAVSATSLSTSGAFSGQWSKNAAGAPEALLESWVAEVRSPVEEKLNLAPDPNVPAPSSELVAQTEDVLEAPVRPQPWTLREEKSLDYLVARYSDGARSMRAPAGSGYGRRSVTRASDGGGGDPRLSPKFLGTELPWTRFFRAQGEVVDVDDFRGKKKVAVVVLRGMSRDVCVYCVTQTEAICDYAEEFAKEDCEVFVVYPGGRYRLDAFMDSFKKFTKRDGEPPIGVLYDRNMELVERMGITSEFAIPSTFVLDRNGRIRYSYVGTDVEDRPPVETVLEAVRAL